MIVFFCFFIGCFFLLVLFELLVWDCVFSMDVVGFFRIGLIGDEVIVGV